MRFIISYITKSFLISVPIVNCYYVIKEHIQYNTLIDLVI